MLNGTTGSSISSLRCATTWMTWQLSPNPHEHLVDYKSPPRHIPWVSDHRLRYRLSVVSVISLPPASHFTQLQKVIVFLYSLRLEKPDSKGARRYWVGKSGLYYILFSLSLPLRMFESKAARYSLLGSKQQGLGCLSVSSSALASPRRQQDSFGLWAGMLISIALIGLFCLSIGARLSRELEKLSSLHQLQTKKSHFGTSSYACNT